MRPSKEIKENKGFKGALRAGIIIILFLSLLISWISVVIIRSVDGKGEPKGEEKIEEVITEGRDTVFVEKIKEVNRIDTVYKYIQPLPKPKTEDHVAPKKDTLYK